MDLEAIWENPHQLNWKVNVRNERIKWITALTVIDRGHTYRCQAGKCSFRRNLCDENALRKYKAIGNRATIAVGFSWTSWRQDEPTATGLGNTHAHARNWTKVQHKYSCVVRLGQIARQNVGNVNSAAEKCRGKNRSREYPFDVIRC